MTPMSSLAWNRDCANKAGEDKTWEVQYAT
jgi:hypothetical protein